MEENRIKISVIITTCDDANKIEECINSILEQTLEEIEVICIDEGSSDNTLEKLYHMQTIDNRVQAYWRIHNSAGDARKFALNIAKGKYIYFIDANVILKNNLLERAYFRMEKNNADMAILEGKNCNMQMKKGKLLPYCVQKKRLPEEEVFSGSEASVLGAFSMEIWTKIFNIDFIKKQINDEILEDDSEYAMILATILSERVVVVDKSLAYYRKGEMSNIPYISQNEIESFFEKYENIDCRLKEKSWYDEIHVGFLKVFLNECVYMYEMAETVSAKQFFIQYIHSDSFKDMGVFDIDEDDQNASYHKISGLIKGVAWKNKLDLAKRRKEFVVKQQSILHDEPKVTVIVPCYNIEKYVGECIDSLINQTLKEIEIVCVNDGSSDSTEDIILDYAMKDERITVVSQENGGLSVARNTGVKNARGKYICFVDSDDLLELNTLEELYRDITEGDFDILYFDGDSFFDNEDIKERTTNYEGYYIRKYDYTGINNGAELLAKFLQNDEYRQSACLQLIRRQYFLDKDLWFHPGILHEDNSFTFKAMLNSENIGHVNKVFYLRRLADNSIMTSAKNFGHTYGYFATLLDMLEVMKNVELDVEQQIIVMKLLSQVINTCRGLYSALNENDKYIYECLDPMERELYYSWIVSYAELEEKKKDLALEKKTELAKKNERINLLKQKARERENVIRRERQKNKKLKNKLKKINKSK